MTLTNKIAWDDTILPFQLDRADIRGRVARLDGVLNRTLAQHTYPALVEEMVAEAVVLTALIGQTMDLRWKLSLQIRGNGPLRIIATDYFAPQAKGDPAQIRAYASFDAERLQLEKGTAFSMIGQGMFALLIDQGAGAKPYNGITPLAGGALATCAETYFAQSEQLPTRFSVALERSTGDDGSQRWRAGGMMLQHMPPASPHAADAGLLDASSDDKGENWTRACLHLDTIKDSELASASLSPTDLLVRLFHEEKPRVFDAQPLKFGCTCGPEKVVQTMSIYSAKDIAKMTDANGKVTADCQFCGAHYELDPDTLGFQATRKPQ